MAYLKPPAFQRVVFNKLAMRFGIGNAVTLATTGRKSGEPIKIPVVLSVVNGATHIVSARGEAFWVKNVRANPACELTVKGKTTKYLAVELPPADCAEIIEVYKKAAGRAVTGYWTKLPDAKDHPTFRLDPA